MHMALIDNSLSNPYIHIRPTQIYNRPTLIFPRPTSINPCPNPVYLRSILTNLRPTLIFIHSFLIYPSPILLYLHPAMIYIPVLYLRPTLIFFHPFLIYPSPILIYLHPAMIYISSFISVLPWYFSILFWYMPVLSWYISVLPWYISPSHIVPSYLEWSGDCDGLYGDLGSSHLAAYPNPEIFRFNLNSYSSIDIDWPVSFVLTGKVRICKYNFSCLFQLFLKALARGGVKSRKFYKFCKFQNRKLGRRINPLSQPLNR